MRQLGFDVSFGFGIALIGYVALLALPLAIIVTLGLIRWFRARVARSMRATAGARTPVRAPRSGGAPGELQIERLAAPSKGNTASVPLVARARGGARQLAAIYAIAAAVFPLLVAGAFAVSLEHDPRSNLLLAYGLLTGLFVLVFGTAAVLAPLVAVRPQPRYLLFAVVILLALLQLADRSLGTHMTWLWLLVAPVPTLAVLLLNMRRLRAIGPVVFAATLLLLYGVVAGQCYGVLYAIDFIGPLRFVRPELAGLPIVEAGQRYFDWLTSLPPAAIMAEISALAEAPMTVIRAENADRLTTGVWLGFLAIAGVLTALGVAAAWAFMRWLARRYRLHRSSDQMLTVDVLMLIFGLPMLLIHLLPLEAIKAAGAIGGLLGYKLVASWGLRRRRRTTPQEGPRPLLLLRVFGHDRRTQGLLEDLGRRWRQLGPIRLIGGTDSAYGTIEPFEFFEFLNGRLSRAFVRDEADLESRLGPESALPDPDGLYRIEDFFCHDDTWRMAVTRLAHDAAAVLMDLRGFSPANQGCIFEIEELLATVPLRRIVLLVDPTSDLPFLEQTLADAWRTLPSGSPNAAPGAHRLRVLQAAGRPRQTLATLLGLLCESAASPSPARP